MNKMITYENNIIKEIICGNTIESDKDQERKIYDLIDYYEMNLYMKTKTEELSLRNHQIFEKNQDNIKKFKEQINYITKELNNQKIPYCILVGIPFSERYYDNPQLRLQEDIDFFVNQYEFEKIKQIMRDIGYYQFGNDNPEKKHITFLKNGNKFTDTSLEGKCAVKFYRRMSDIRFCSLDFSYIQQFIEVFNGYRVLCSEMALVHLIFHAHYYDIHPKIMADIYMICKNSNIDWLKVMELIKSYKLERVANIIFSILCFECNLDNIPKYILKNDSDELFLSKILSSKLYWEKIFVRLNSKEMTFLRAYLYDKNNYEKVFEQIIKHNSERRVSAIHEEFKLI